MESVGTLIDTAFAAGANTLNGISFSASDTEEAETEAMKKAVADAKNKAEMISFALLWMLFECYCPVLLE